jgi:hypothetical protein
MDRAERRPPRLYDGLTKAQATAPSYAHRGNRAQQMAKAVKSTGNSADMLMWVKLPDG